MMSSFGGGRGRDDGGGGFFLLEGRGVCAWFWFWFWVLGGGWDRGVEVARGLGALRVVRGGLVFDAAVGCFGIGASRSSSSSSSSSVDSEIEALGRGVVDLCWLEGLGAKSNGLADV